MANEIRDGAATVYRDYTIDGAPSSGAHRPVKLDIRALFDTVETEIDARIDVVADLAITGVSWKEPVRVATTAAGTLASDFSNGDTVDGEVLATGDRILVKNQAAPSENGIYVVTAGAPTRATDADSEAELLRAGVLVSEGTANVATQWVLTTDAPIVVGTTGLTFQQFGDQSLAAELTTEVVAARGTEASLADRLGTSAYVDDHGYSAKLVDSAGRVMIAFDGQGALAGSHGFVTQIQRQLHIGSAQDVIYNTERHAITFTYTDRNGLAIMGQSNANATATAVGISLTQPFNNVNSAGAALVSAAGAETCIMGATSHAKWRQLKDMKPWDSWAIDYDWVYSALNGPSGTILADLDKPAATYNSAVSTATTAYNTAVAATATYAERGLIWLHGETDADVGTTQATYLSLMIQLKDDWNTDMLAVTGQTDRIPMFVAQPAVGDTGLIDPTHLTTVLAMLEAAETDDEIYIVVPGYIMEFGDGLHYINYAQRLIGEYVGKACHNYYIERRTPGTVRPISWEIIDPRTIEIEFFVPVPPLVFDVENVWPGDLAMGFAVYDAADAEVTISDVKILAKENKVRITTAADVSAGFDVSYATKTYSRATTGGILAGNRRGGRGNLRDSDNTLSYYPDMRGNHTRLHNWCAIFYKTLA